MGCDIHCVLQRRNKKEDQWETILVDVFPGRNYTFFAWLSGVRGQVGNKGPIAKENLPNGLTLDAENEIEVPAGLTENNKYWLGDHSFGHIDVCDFVKAKIPSLYRDELSHYRNGLNVFLGVDYFLSPNDYRLVFGYDS